MLRASDISISIKREIQGSEPPEFVYNMGMEGKKKDKINSVFWLIDSSDCYEAVKLDGEVPSSAPSPPFPPAKGFYIYIRNEMQFPELEIFYFFS